MKRLAAVLMISAVLTASLTYALTREDKVAELKKRCEKMTAENKVGRIYELIQGTYTSGRGHAPPSHVTGKIITEIRLSDSTGIRNILFVWPKDNEDFNSYKKVFSSLKKGSHYNVCVYQNQESGYYLGEIKSLMIEQD
jgi:hypothetical protein